MLVLCYCHMFLLSYHFYAFCRTNLLTRCQVPVPCFCCFCISEKSQQEISSDCPQNLRRFLCDVRHTRTKGQPGGPPTGQGRPWPTAPPGPAGGTRTCSWGTPSAPSDAYKIPFDLKPGGAAIIFQKLGPDTPSPKTLVRG